MNATLNVTGLQVLIVEDDADTARNLALLLGVAGHKVRVAKDGLKAVAMANEQKPDVVLLDIGLPGLNGYEVAMKLHEDQPRQTPFIVAVTGYGQCDDLRRVEEAGIDVHILKPADPDDLLALLARFQRDLAEQAGPSAAPRPPSRMLGER
jgi:CheY-like chemotaxis protein